jgi:phosphatidylglycerophosphatase A
LKTESGQPTVFNFQVLYGMIFFKIIATFFGTGFIKKGGGTVAAAIACVICYWAAKNYDAIGRNLWLQAWCIMLIFFVGVWCGNKVEAVWGKDSYRVVWDEVLGMCISLFAILPTEQKWQTYAAALVLFRFFDIVKPLYIKKTENFAGGWGVMLDDVLAGIYANIIVHIILIFHWL